MKVPTADATLLNQTWARPNLDADVDHTLASLEEGLPVRLIATDRKDLKTFLANEDLASVIDRPDVSRFDYVPVISSNEDHRIIGLLHRANLAKERIDKGVQVSQRMASLSEENLISSDTSILSFLRTADAFPCRLLVDGVAIGGLVSISDIQRLPVRPVLFLLITQIELLMTEAIRSEFGNESKWHRRLSAGRREILERKIKESQQKDMLIDDLLMTDFCDKIDIIAKRDGLPNKGKFRSEMGKIQDLRDNVAHSNDFARTPEAARSTCEVVRLAELYVKRLRGDPYRCVNEPKGDEGQEP